MSGAKRKGASPAAWASATSAGAGQVPSKGLSLLLDTNVWIDFFVDRSRRHEAAVSLVKAARAHDVPLFTAIEATKDVFFTVACELKRMQRDETGTVTEAFANAANEAAWSCLSTLRRQSCIVAADASDMVEAMVQRASHGDYEDNLVVAAAMRASATHIVSSDKQLQKRSPVDCIGIEEAVCLIEGSLGCAQ